jgi:hypothetical protein
LVLAYVQRKLLELMPSLYLGTVPPGSDQL